MSQLLAIKARTKAITNLRQVTRAMELVTKTKIGRIRQNAAGAKAYLALYRQLFAEVSAAVPAERRREEGSAVRYLVAFLSRKGFCGGFNDRLLSLLSQEESGAGPDDRIYLLGKKTGKWSYAIKREFTHIDAGEHTYAELCAPLVDEWTSAFKTGRRIEVRFAYNAFISILEQKPTIETVYPVDLPASEASYGEPIFEPDPAAMRETIAKGYFKALIDKVFWESAAGEYCSRLISMKTANDNATLILDSLNLLYNKTRQMKITQELSEIVSAFDVLKMMQGKKLRDEEE